MNRRPAARVVLAVPILPCVDVEETIAFYENRLGFMRDWVWGEPATDGGVRLGDVQLFFMRNVELSASARDREVMLFVEDVDALHAEHVRRGAPMSEPLRDEPWGLREYSVVDPQGHRLRFAESVEIIRARSATVLARRAEEAR